MHLLTIGLYCHVVIHLAIGTSPPECSWADYRLPKAIQPLHYDLFMNAFDVTNNDIFDGKVTIEATVKQATDRIVLNAKALTINSVTLSQSVDEENPGLCSDETEPPPAKIPGKEKCQETPATSGRNSPRKKTIDIKNQSELKENEQYFILISDRLEQGTNFFVDISFTGTIGKVENKDRGFYTYNDENGRPVWNSFLEPNFARAVFPCFDEPEFKATFSLSIVRPRHLLTIFNTPLVETVDYKVDNLKCQDSLVVDKYKPTPQMSTYVLAFVIGDFKFVEKSYVNGDKVFPVRVFASKEKIDSGKGNYALDLAVKLIEYYTNLFGVNLPLEKLDLANVKLSHNGAFEGWGLITLGDSMLLYHPDHHSLSGKEKVTRMLAHEISHLWVGDLVTLKWWNEIWMQEGMADFLAYSVPGEIDTEMNLEMNFVAMMRGKYVFAMDISSSTTPVGKEVLKPDTSMHTALTYMKGASLFRMLESIIGKRGFMEGFKKYIDNYKYKNTQSNDLWNYLQSCNADHSLNIPDIMKSWTTQPGFPVIKVDRQGQTVSFQQKPFTTDESFQPQLTWVVPFQYRAGNKDVKTLWVREKNMRNVPVPATSPWIIGNVDGKGYYRVNYDEGNWQAIINQLLKDHTSRRTLLHIQFEDDAIPD